MSRELQWLHEQRGAPDEPEWARETLRPVCPSTLRVTAVRARMYRHALYRDEQRNQTIWQEREIELATEWHWETRNDNAN